MLVAPSIIDYMMLKTRQR